MIMFKQGDLLVEDAEAIVNTVNCVGVMGRGIALQFKKQFPDNYTYYETACKSNAVVPGKMLIFETNSLMNPRYIINFPTKRHWRDASRIEDIETGLTDLVKNVQELGINSIAVPPLGCGLGGLKWNEVRPLMESAFDQLVDVKTSVFEPSGAPSAEKMAHSQKIPNMTPGRAALVSLTKRYLDGLLDPIVTLLEIHKLMYFLQESGEPLRLNFAKNIYGPFAINLHHLLNAVEGHYLLGYADGGDKPNKQIQIVAGVEKEADSFLQQRPETVQRINRVAELVDGFETQFGMELLATVHWVAKNEATTLQSVINHTYDWGAEKQKFSQRQIGIAFERLRCHNWLPSENA